MADIVDSKMWAWITIGTLTLWGISLSPLSHFIIATDSKALVSSFFTALLGLGPALKVMLRK
jgi:hypothetical protein